MKTGRRFQNAGMNAFLSKTISPKKCCLTTILSVIKDYGTSEIKPIPPVSEQTEPINGEKSI